MVPEPFTHPQAQPHSAGGCLGAKCSAPQPTPAPHLVGVCIPRRRAASRILWVFTSRQHPNKLTAAPTHRPGCRSQTPREEKSSGLREQAAGKRQDTGNPSCTARASPGMPCGRKIPGGRRLLLPPLPLPVILIALARLFAHSRSFPPSPHREGLSHSLLCYFKLRHVREVGARSAPCDPRKSLEGAGRGGGGSADLPRCLPAPLCPKTEQPRQGWGYRAPSLSQPHSCCPCEVSPCHQSRAKSRELVSLPGRERGACTQHPAGTGGSRCPAPKRSWEHAAGLGASWGGLLSEGKLAFQQSLDPNTERIAKLPGR